MGCCCCAQETGEILVFTQPNTLKRQENMYNKSDSFDDISLPSHNDECVMFTSSNNNDMYLTDAKSAISSPNSPRPRSASFTPHPKKPDLESAFLYKNPYLVKAGTPKFADFAESALENLNNSLEKKKRKDVKLNKLAEIL